MRDLVTYDYAIVRVVPKVERAEFVNVGVIVSCPEREFLLAQDRGRRAAAHVARSHARHPVGAGASRCHTDDLRWRRAGGADWPAIAARAFLLARRAAEHDHPDVADAYRFGLRSRSPGRTIAADDGAATERLSRCAYAQLDRSSALALLSMPRELALSRTLPT